MAQARSETELMLSDASQLYSGLSYVGSGNIGRDVFEQGNRGLYAIEDGYLGLRVGDREDSSQWDVSYGRQQYKIGSGMLISVGAYMVLSAVRPLLLHGAHGRGWSSEMEQGALYH